MPSQVPASSSSGSSHTEEKDPGSDAGYQVMLTRQIWDVSLEAFPQTGGQVVGIDVIGYDTLEGAERFY